MHTQEASPLADLRDFKQTEQYYKHQVGPYSILLTEGCEYVAREGKAGWLYDIILSHQRYAQVREQYVQFWELKKRADGLWSISCRNYDGIVLKEQLLHNVDFPLNSFHIDVKNNICFLPTEG